MFNNYQCKPYWQVRTNATRWRIVVELFLWPQFYCSLEFNNALHPKQSRTRYVNVDVYVNCNTKAK